jgi:hypothetical protein
MMGELGSLLYVILILLVLWMLLKICCPYFRRPRHKVDYGVYDRPNVKSMPLDVFIERLYPDVAPSSQGASPQFPQRRRKLNPKTEHDEPVAEPTPKEPMEPKEVKEAPQE